MASILGPGRRGNVRHKPANHHQFHRGRSLKPQRPLPLARMMVSQKSQCQEIPLTSSQLFPELFCSSERTQFYLTETYKLAALYSFF
ncbi:hypothetical protein ATANTOWER_031991 [Ataeniobius toweri]|uniref:Uncharacterized protein n=1 Tax=Ataeniobius toweri TaxID=208326 RepID=A0ABU7AJ82_9TELE|nr:hypothetical protein [Ataeniobius toweri]